MSKKDDLSSSNQEFEVILEEFCKTLTREEALEEIKANLQVAIKIELATIPIYLYTYYSIFRKGRTGEQMNDVDLYLNEAGARIMSVAVEEMLHMSLGCNILAAMGEQPYLYGHSPASYPTKLPYHNPKSPPGPGGQTEVDIPLAKFSYEQLWHFLQIEYPSRHIHPDPKKQNWNSLGQFYAYIECLIKLHCKDEDFQKRGTHFQIQPYNYSPNNIDTAYPGEKYNSWDAATVHAKGSKPPSAAAAAQFANGKASGGLIVIDSKDNAIAAIKTIVDQGEGSDLGKRDGGHELSHYYKFLTVQAHLAEYADWKSNPNNHETLPKRPAPPAAIEPSYTAEQLAFTGGNNPNLGVLDWPSNPTTDSITDPQAQKVSRAIDAIYQYMLIMSETLVRVPDTGHESTNPHGQKLFFNEGLHRTMIWVLDKAAEVCQKNTVNDVTVVPTFANKPLLGKPGGDYQDAFSKLSQILSDAQFENSPFNYLFRMVIEKVPDVAPFWSKEPLPSKKPEGFPTPGYPYKDVPTFPGYAMGTQPAELPLHACMGLNSCKGSDRFGKEGPADGPNPRTPNACAGQGYCSTAGYNFLQPENSSDHQCHVQNDCRNQGGCGLYGTAEEQNQPGMNNCKSLGSCATPINAERFSTTGPNKGKSVWARARKVFEEDWPNRRQEILKKHPHLDLPEKLGSAPEPFAKTGPPYQWVSDDNESRGNMTACGSSGLSGAGGCT